MHLFYLHEAYFNPLLTEIKPRQALHLIYIHTHGIYTHTEAMHAPSHCKHGETVAPDRAYNGRGKFGELTGRNAVYVIKMRRGLRYEVLADCMDMSEEGLMKYRGQAAESLRAGCHGAHCTYGISQHE